LRRFFCLFNTHFEHNMKLANLPSARVSIAKEEYAALVPPLPLVMLEPLVRATLLEDLGRAGDITTDAIRSYHANVTCTRKTTSGLRAIQKYAVRVGGGSNHRFGLDDAVLIKDNHVAIAGSVRHAVERARATVGHMVKIELEVDTLQQLEGALALGVDVVLLDNMFPETLLRAVAMVDGRAITEVSGRISPETAPIVAATGVDLIAIGWLTHSARVLDIGLDS
jgi:nicotinate-nucleotide pyrophosphorylase (carboxylating)